MLKLINIMFNPLALVEATTFGFIGKVFSKGLDFLGLDQDKLNVANESDITRSSTALFNRSKDKILEGMDKTGFESELEAAFQKAFRSGFSPEEVDFKAAARLFAPRRRNLQLQFQSQLEEGNRLASRLGRSINDPILQAKLRRGFLEQESALDVQETDSILKLMQQRFGMGMQAASIAQNPFQRALMASGAAAAPLGAERKFQSDISTVEAGGMTKLGQLAGIAGNIAKAKNAF